MSDSLISKEQWNEYKAYFNTPEKLRLLLVPSDINDMKENSRESSKKDILYEKLTDIITMGVSVSNEEIEELYRDKYEHMSEKPPLESVSDELYRELLNSKKNEAKKKWWREQYKELDVEIKDRRFEKVAEYLDMK